MVNVYDGTGHGTTSQCYINSTKGFTGPGDNTPTDLTVCSGDSLSFKVLYAFPSQPASTTYTVTIGSSDAFVASNASSAGNWCASDASGRFTATKTGVSVAPGASVTCSKQGTMLASGDVAA